MTFVAFAPNGVGWFIRYSSKQCIWGPEASSFPTTWNSLIQELESTHPRKDECIDFVAFGPHDLLLVRYENGRSQMILPEDPVTRSRISAELVREAEERIHAGWTLGNRTTLCSFDTNRWFIEWRRGTSSEFRFSMGLGDRERGDLERVKKVLSGVGSDGAQVVDKQTAQLVGPARFDDKRLAADNNRLRQTRGLLSNFTLVGSCRLGTYVAKSLHNKQGSESPSPLNR